MGTMSKMLSYSTGVVAHVAVAIARILHLSAVLPAAFQLKKSEDPDGQLVVLHDGDEYVMSVLVETLGQETSTSEKYIEAVKIETVEPSLVVPAPDKKLRDASDKMADTDESSDADNLSPADEICDSPLESLEPDEEIVELSDEEDVPVSIPKAERGITDKLGRVPPRGLNVVAFNKKKVNCGHKSTDLKAFATMFMGMPYASSAGGSMVMVPELANSSGSSDGVDLGKLCDQLEQAKKLEGSRLSDSASVETNATEATEEDRLRGLSDSLETANKGEDDELARDKMGLMDIGAAATGFSESRPIGGMPVASSQSSMLSSSSEDDLSGVRAEFGTPSFIPTIVTATSKTVAL
jgi:hypothetical protein